MSFKGAAFICVKTRREAALNNIAKGFFSVNSVILERPIQENARREIHQESVKSSVTMVDSFLWGGEMMGEWMVRWTDDLVNHSSVVKR